MVTGQPYTQETKPHTSEAKSHPRSRFQWLAVAMELAACALLAIALYLGVMKWLMARYPLYPPDTQRILEVKNLCASLSKQCERTGELPPTALVFGSSVALEGIDAEIIDQRLESELQTYNLAVSGLCLRELLLLLPAIEAAHPAIVVVGMDTFGFQENDELNGEKLQAYRNAGLLDAMSPDLRDRILQEFFSSREKETLTEPSWQALIDSRALPLFYMESRFRARANAELRMEGLATNFKAPWVRRIDLTDAKMDREVKAATERFSKMTFQPNNRQLRALRFITDYLLTKQIKVVAVLWPSRQSTLAAYSPDYVPTLKETLRTSLTASDLTFVDSMQLLAESEYSDSIHPNAAGRKKLSETLATALVKVIPSKKLPVSINQQSAPAPGT